jgi:uncharacterized protein (DUF2235 family)
MTRNLVICCDGTSNRFGERNTNVVRVVQCLARSESQLAYYDPGVGTIPAAGALTWLQHRLSTLAGLAFGAGLERNVEEAYCWLMDWWEPEDRVFLFGFSRGAYTVRILAGMLHTVGLLEKGAYNLVPYAFDLYRSIGQERAAGEGRYHELCAEFRRTYCRHVPGSEEQRFPVHFSAPR